MFSNVFRFFFVIKAKRQIELQNGEYGFTSQFKIDTPFLSYYRKMCDDRHGNVESRGNWGNWYSCLKHLERYCSEKTTFISVILHENKVETSSYQTMVDNYQKAVSKLSELGGNNEEVVISILKNHIKNGEWEDQRTGLIDALYGAKINGKLIDRRKLGILIDYTVQYDDFQFTRKMNKLLGISD